MVAGRLGRMGVVAGMHVGIFFMIANSLGIVSLTKPPEVLVGTVIDQPRTHDDPPPRTEPVREQPPITVPIPETPPIDSDSQDDRIAAQPVDPLHRDIIGPGTAEVLPAIVPVRQDTRHPLSQPRYPSSDIREGNEGNADVEVFVMANGRVGDARIARSSGFPRLDQSAIEEAKRNWRLVPATRDGVPFAQWYKVRVTFKLTNQ